MREILFVVAINGSGCNTTQVVCGGPDRRMSLTCGSRRATVVPCRARRCGWYESQLRLVLSRMTRLLKLRSHCRCTSPLGRRLPSTSPTTGICTAPQVADRHVQRIEQPQAAVRTQSWLFHRWGRLSMSIRLSGEVTSSSPIIPSCGRWVES